MAYNDFVQSIANAIKDALTLDDVVNGEPNTQAKSRLGRLIYSLSTINHRVDIATNQANKNLTDLADAINTAAAAGAGANGWTDMAIAVSENVNQRQINDGLESISQLLAIKNPRNGMRVYVKSYYTGLGMGGGWFTYTSSNISAKVKADPQKGLYVANGDGSTGGWVREYSGGELQIEWFGAKPVTGFDNYNAIRGAVIASACYMKTDAAQNPSIVFSAGVYEVRTNNLLGDIDFASYGLSTNYAFGLKLQGQGKMSTEITVKADNGEIWLYDNLASKKESFIDCHFLDMSIAKEYLNYDYKFNLVRMYATGMNKRFRFYRCFINGDTIMSLHGTGNADLHRFHDCQVLTDECFVEFNNNQAVAVETYSTDFEVKKHFIVVGDNGGGSFKQFGGNLEMHTHHSDTSDHFLFKDNGALDGKMGLGNCDFLSQGVRYEIHGANKKLFYANRLSTDRPVIYTFDNCQMGTVSGGSRQAVYARGFNLVVNFNNTILNDDFTFYGESSTDMAAGANAPIGVVINFDKCCAGRSKQLATRCSYSGNKVVIRANQTYQMPAGVGFQHIFDDFTFGWYSANSGAVANVKIGMITNGGATSGLGATPYTVAFPKGAYIKRIVVKDVASDGTGAYKIKVGNKDTNTVIASSTASLITDKHDIDLQDFGIYDFDKLSVWAEVVSGEYKLIRAWVEYI